MDGMTIFLCVSAWLVAFGALGGYVSVQVDRDAAEGLILGVLFGPLGVIVAALLPPDKHEDENPVVSISVDPEQAENECCREALADLVGQRIR